MVSRYPHNPHKKNFARRLSSIANGTSSDWDDYPKLKPSISSSNYRNQIIRNTLVHLEENIQTTNFPWLWEKTIWSLYTNGKTLRSFAKSWNLCFYPRVSNGQEHSDLKNTRKFIWLIPIVEISSDFFIRKVLKRVRISSHYCFFKVWGQVLTAGAGGSTVGYLYPIPGYAVPRFTHGMSGLFYWPQSFYLAGRDSCI
jgi:hypothetical protein